MTDTWETEGGAVRPEKTVENRATTVVPLRYSGRTYDLTINHGHRGDPDWLEKAGLDNGYVALNMYVDDADIIDEHGAVIGQGDTNSIAFHTRESFVNAVEAIIRHGVKAFGVDVLDDLGIY